jgi:hypothetical protein
MLDRRRVTAGTRRNEEPLSAGPASPVCRPACSAASCTSFVERQNLTIRMEIRRFARLTNAFSKKPDNHKAACAMHFAHHNLCRIHKSPGVTPAMEAGITNHVWSVRDLLSEGLAMEKQVILVASFDPSLADVRKRVLESAGYIVVSADDLLAVRKGCELGTVALVVIGYSLSPAAKRGVWDVVRQVCGKATPILELYGRGIPILAGEAVTAHASLAPDDFVEQVRTILKG